MPLRNSRATDRDAALTQWWNSSPGRSLLAAESELLGEALEDVFGWELLQVGAWGPGRELIAGSRTRHRSVLALPSPASDSDVIGRPAQLPIASDSVDAVVLPHTLEFATDPYAIVREVDRVLAAEGHLLVVGFRPWSVWGLRARLSRSGFPPGLRRVLSQRRLHDWLVLLGYEVAVARAYLYRSPWSRGLASGETGRILRRGLNPLPANAYLLKARKRVYTLTPIRPRLRERSPAVLGGLVKPTTRSSAS